MQSEMDQILTRNRQWAILARHSPFEAHTRLMVCSTCSGMQKLQVSVWGYRLLTFFKGIKNPSCRGFCISEINQHARVGNRTIWIVFYLALLGLETERWATSHATIGQDLQVTQTGLKVYLLSWSYVLTASSLTSNHIYEGDLYCQTLKKIYSFFK